jgi:hypothetical protein
MGVAGWRLAHGKRTADALPAFEHRVMNADCAELQHTFWPLGAPKNKSPARSNKTRMRVPC